MISSLLFFIVFSNVNCYSTRMIFCCIWFCFYDWIFNEGALWAARLHSHGWSVGWLVGWSISCKHFDKRSKSV